MAKKKDKISPEMAASLASLHASLCAEEKEEEKKKTFRIACDWEVCGVMYVRANSLEEAIKLAEDKDDAPLPTDDEYIDDSFKVNKEMTDHFCEEDHKLRQ